MRKLLLAAALTIAGLEVLAHTGVLAALLSPHYLPHRFCYLQQPWLVWTNVSMDGLFAISYAWIFVSLLGRGQVALYSGFAQLHLDPDCLWDLYRGLRSHPRDGGGHRLVASLSGRGSSQDSLCRGVSPTAVLFARAAPALAANIRQFLDMLSTTREEKDQAVRSPAASENLVVAGRISASISHKIKNPLETRQPAYPLSADRRTPSDLAAMAKTASSELKRAENIAQSNLALFRRSSAPGPLSLSSW